MTTVEMITNGGFENGIVIAPWVKYVTGYGSVNSNWGHGHTGNYGLELYQKCGVYQVLSTPVAVEDVASFDCWTKDEMYMNYKVIWVTIYYDDATSDSFNISVVDAHTIHPWEYINLKTYLRPTGTIIKILFDCPIDNNYDDILLDDVSLMKTVYVKTTSSICTDPIFKLYIDENDPPTTLRDYLNIHYTKSHPNQDPDTFEIIVDPSEGVTINYFDRVKITKYDVNEFYGFVEEITPNVGESGLEYRLTGRCWKLILWKKWSERYQESREIGPVDAEGNIESGFFGQVKPEELIKFILRCPISEHPKGKVRQKIGWGIASDFWSCCANATADMFYPDWVGLRYTGLSWRGYASVEALHYSNLVCNAFDSTYLDWTEVGASPYLHTDSTADQIKTGTPPWGQKEGLFGFADLGGTAETIYTVKLYVKAMVQGYSAKISVHLYDGASTFKIGYLNPCPYGYGYTEFNCIAILDTPTKVNNAKIYLEMETGYHALVGVIYAYLHVEYSESTDADIFQQTDDWFVVNLGAKYDDVTAILIECRNNPMMYARNYKIQYCTISNCCAEGDNDGFWNDFDPVINEVNNDVRDILHSWKPQDDVRGIRIKLTDNAIYPWEISQIYIWQSDAYKYRLLNEGD